MMSEGQEKNRWKRRLLSYSMDARADLLSVYMAVLFVGLLLGIAAFLLFGKRADAGEFKSLWVSTRAFSGYTNGGAFARFFCGWFFRYEKILLLLLLFAVTLGAPVLCGGVCLWRGFAVGYGCAMVAGNRFSGFFIGYAAVTLCISVLFVIASCKSVWFFKRLCAHLRQKKKYFIQDNVMPLAVSFVLQSAAIAVLLVLCAIAAQAAYP